MRHSVFVTGTRAQLVKVAPVLTRAVASDLPHSVWLAGQHTESIDDLMRDFQLKSPIVYAPSGKERSNIIGLLSWFPGALIACRRYIRECIRDGLRFLAIIFKVATLYSPLKIFLPISGFFFVTGLGYYAYTYLTIGRFTNMSLLVFSASVIIFLIGLISEQTTAMMYSKT